MRAALSLSRRIAALGRPTLLRRLQPEFVRAVDLLAFLLPPGALLLRVETGSDLPLATALAILLGGLVLLALAWTLGRDLTGRRDPLVAARALDRAENGRELFLTATELAGQAGRLRLYPALRARAEVALTRLASRRPRPPLRFPALRRVLLLLMLSLLVLLAPALGRGLLGPRLAGGGAVGGGDGGSAPEGAPAASADVAGASSKAAAAGDLAGRLEIRAGSDRAIYLLGEEIVFAVELRALEALRHQDFEIVLLVDGELEMALPLPEGFDLPGEAGATSRAEWQLRDRLRLVDRYHRGLLALDARIRLRDRDDPAATVAAPQVRIQIDENSERVQARRPTPVEQKPKPKPRPEPRKEERDQEQRPNEKNEPEKKPRPAPGQGQGEDIPEDLPSKDYVVEPLFSGDETSRRKVDVYDRELEDAAPDLPEAPRAEPRRRRYERMAEAEMQRLQLDGRERRAVRRYLEALQPVTEKKDG